MCYLIQIYLSRNEEFPLEISKSQYYRRYHIILAKNLYNLIHDKLGTNYSDNTMLIWNAPSDYLKDGKILNPTIFQNLMYGEDIMLSSIEKVCKYFDLDVINALSEGVDRDTVSPETVYTERLSKNLISYIDSLPDIVGVSGSSIDELVEKAFIALTRIPPSPEDPKLQKSLLKKALEGKDLKLSSITRICDYFDIELEMLLKPVS